MFSSAARRIVGLDVGQTSTKMVVLDVGSRPAKLIKTVVLDNRAEGILSEAELGEYMKTWLKEQGYRGEDVVLNLPQYMAVTQISDFPPGGGSALDEMVAYETQQLSGLSDDVFLKGYRQLEPNDKYRNPVLIGVCREQMVRQRLEAFAVSQMTVTDLVMEGEALAVAFGELHPSELTSERVLLLDIGAENTTCVVLQRGQVVYTGSLMTGGDIFSEAVARHLKVGEVEAERVKRESRVNSSDPLSPLSRMAKTFLVELQSALDNWWQQSHGDDAGPLHFNNVYLSGGGMLLNGLGDYLQSGLGTSVSYLTVPGVETHANAARLTIAYGLALQARTGKGRRQTISFAPDDLRWSVTRQKRVPVLVGAVGLLAVVLGLHLAATWVSEGSEHRFLSAQQANLDQCRKLAPEVRVEEQQIESLEQMLRPFAAVGSRNINFVEAVKEISASKDSEDWFVLLADEDSYYDRQGMMAARLAPTPVVAPKTPSRGSFAPDGSGTAPVVTPAKLTSGFEPWRMLYVSGFTRERRSDSFATVKQMIERLNNPSTSMFAKADLLAAEEISDLNYQIRQPWLDAFRMRAVTLKLPIKDPEFEPKLQPQPAP